MSGTPVLQRLADQTGHRDDATGNPTSRPWRYLIVLPCRLAAAAIDVREFARFILSGIAATIGNMVAVWLTRRFPVLRNCVIGRDRYGRWNIIRAFKVFCVPVAFVEPRDRRSGEVLNRLCDGLR
jgi:hypothetical protein